MDPFIGEIRAVGFDFAPENWAVCQGQLLPLRSYMALYSVLGVTYGGDGINTFGLPDLRGRLIVQPGQGSGLSSYTLGQVSGQETVKLLAANLPQHSHALVSATVHASSAPATLATPTGNFLAATQNLHYGSSADGQMAGDIVSGLALPAGGDGAHDNHMPYLPLTYIIALQGIFPPRP
jgi:microcystin-dependent protein